MNSLCQIMFCCALLSVCTLAACDNTTKTNASKTIEEAAKESVELQDTLSLSEAEKTPVFASFVDESGNVINTTDLKGKVVFINFWATWCPPCREEMPSIQNLYNKFKSNSNIVFLIVEIENDEEGTKKFLNDFKLSLPIVYPQGNIPREWLGGAIPTTVILDKSGKVAAKQEGMYDFANKEIEDFIQQLVNQ